MEALGIPGLNRRANQDYEFVSRPNRSLSPLQQRLVFWSLAIPCMGIAGFFAALGYWLMLPFAGIEVGVLAWAFENLREHDRDYESVSISGDCLRIEGHELGKTWHRELNVHWTRVDCICERGENLCRLSVRSHGETIELGRYLNDQGRMELAATLRSLCQKNR